MLWVVALSGCGNQVVDATSKMDASAPASSGGASGASGSTSTSGGANGVAGAGGKSSGGASSGGATAASGGAATGDGGSSAGGRGSGGRAGASAGGNTSTSMPDAGADAAPIVTGTLCKNPVFTTSDTNGGWSNGGYYVHNNMWNSGAGLGPETLSACSYHSFYVVSNQTNNAGAVKTYPNVHKDYSDVPISSFTSLTSTFAESSPHVGIYDVAYDIWTNGVATSGSTEFMIWVENFHQVPAGTKAKTVTLGGRTYDVWKTSDNHYIAFVPTVVFTSGTIDILEIFKWTTMQGWFPASSTLGQLDFGVEIVETGGSAATFQFTDFSISGG